MFSTQVEPPAHYKVWKLVDKRVFDPFGPSYWYSGSFDGKELSYRLELMDEVESVTYHDASFDGGGVIKITFHNGSVIQLWMTREALWFHSTVYDFIGCDDKWINYASLPGFITRFDDFVKKKGLLIDISEIRDECDSSSLEDDLDCSGSTEYADGCPYPKKINKVSPELLEGVRELLGL
jgi:hypothetical protein